MRGVADEPHLSHPTAPALDRFREVLRNKPAMKVIWAYTFHSWELLGVWAWIAAYLAVAASQGSAVDTKTAGLGALLAGLTHLTSMAGSVIGGHLSDARGRTYVMLVMGSISVVCGFVFGFQPMPFGKWSCSCLTVSFSSPSVSSFREFCASCAANRSAR